MDKEKIINVLNKVEKVSFAVEEFFQGIKDEFGGPVEFRDGNTGWFTEKEEDEDD